MRPAGSSAGKVFAFTCFDGTRGAGRMLDDMGAAGAVQFCGAGPVRHLRLPGNTLQIRGQAVCASIKGIPFEPCFNLDKKDERSFRGSVSGMGFAYCDFHHQGAAQMLMARAVARPRSLRPPEQSAGSHRGPRCRRGSKPRRSRAPKSSRSNPRRNPSLRNRKVRQNCATRPIERFRAKARPGLDPGWVPVRVKKTRQNKRSGTNGVSGFLQLAAAPPGGAACLRNRIRWYSQPIATSTSPRHMNDSAR